MEKEWNFCWPFAYQRPMRYAPTVLPTDPGLVSRLGGTESFLLQGNIANETDAEFFRRLRD